MDLGRYWNITRGNSSEYSQRFYFLPSDFLRSEGSLNEIVFFDSFGGQHFDLRLVLSSTKTSIYPEMIDEVDYILECI
jgi:hypothetical protein